VKKILLSVVLVSGLMSSSIFCANGLADKCRNALSSQHYWAGVGTSAVVVFAWHYFHLCDKLGLSK